MRLFVCVVILLVETVAPQATSAACGRHCHLPVIAQTTVFPVVHTVTELLVPAAAVSFQYMPPPDLAPYNSRVEPTAAAPVAGFAAEPFEVRTGTSTAAALFESRCHSCHGVEAKGGVRLWNSQGQWQPNVSHGRIYKATVLEGRMPKDGGLTETEKQILNEWIGH